MAVQLQGFAYLPGSVQRWFQAGSAPDLQLPNVTKAAVPLMIASVLLEFLLGERMLHNKIYYRRQTWNNFAAGVLGFALTDVFLRGLYVFPYIALYQLFGVKHIDHLQNHYCLLHVGGFLGVDFALYWNHRAGHETNLGWAGHMVHHSSPDMNLSTALRQGITEPIVGFWFYLPLALIIPPDIYVFHRGANLVYQFFLHTQVIKKLGPLEWFMNTPSHHRVHHARNYRSSNYGGVLIIWDRIFGTFEPEKEGKACTYGLDDLPVPLGTYNPMWHQVFHWWKTFCLAYKTGDVWSAFFTRAFGCGMISRLSDDKTKRTIGKSQCDSSPASMVDAYVILQSLLVGAPATLAVMIFADFWHPLSTVKATVVAASLAATCGSFLNESNEGLIAEIVRLFGVLMLVPFCIDQSLSHWIQAYCAASAIAASVIYQRCQKFKRRAVQAKQS